MVLINECSYHILSEKQRILDFDCGNVDLNDFFNNDAFSYQNQMLCEVYFFRHNTTGKIVCTFSLSPEGIKTFDLPNNRRKRVKENIPQEKTLKSYPAFLVGRLGVAKEFNGQGIGSQLMDFIKQYCFDRFPNFCRFLLLDAYNEPAVLKFYQKNDFLTVFSTEEQERNYYRPGSTTESLHTRYMYYDMIHWKNKSEKD
ncbi:MAG: GNAT family N-acetyltransferase [Prevotellaceae bacterium]|jgi:GNAT superfamily N-acetyltransferase|nr:GNAT family N-acetyltransferase [Prevotellaceae bacterium]